jgi:hypothetical protein
VRDALGLDAGQNSAALNSARTTIVAPTWTIAVIVANQPG